MIIKNEDKLIEQLYLLRLNCISILQSIPSGLKNKKHVELENKIIDCSDAETLLKYVTEVLKMIE